MTITINAPCIITPRLLPGVQVGGAFISIEYARSAGHRQHYRYYLDLPDGTSHEGDDISSGCRHSLQSGLESLLSFMSACGDGWSYQERTGRESENADLFPPAIAEWCAANSDELSMLACDLEETKGLIAE